MKFAIRAREVLTRTLIVDGDNLEDACDKVRDAYEDCNLILNNDNSTVDFDCEDDTENFIDIFGKEELDSMEESEEVRDI